MQANTQSLGMRLAKRLSLDTQLRECIDQNCKVLVAEAQQTADRIKGRSSLNSSYKVDSTE